VRLPLPLQLPRIRGLWSVAPTFDPEFVVLDGVIDLLQCPECRAGSLKLDSDGTPADPLPGDACGSNSDSTNLLAKSTNSQSLTATYDLSYAIGKSGTLSLQWSFDDANNSGVGFIIDNIEISCTMQ
jgi:hypothetical protein